MERFKGFLCLSLFAMLSLSSVSTPGAETFRPVVRGKRGAVAAGHPLSAEAGLRLLQQGGNAVDAGCAVILAASVIEFSHFSFGGEVPIIIKPASGPPAVINGQGTAPKLATPEFFLGLSKSGGDSGGAAYRGAGAYVSLPVGGARPGVIPSAGILPATVPAVLDAVITALDRFGTRSLQEVMQPAIELADGFPIDETRVSYIERTRKVFERWPASAKVFLPSGAVPKVGQIFTQPDLARTLREIVKAERQAASRGRHPGLMAARDFFYKGPVARKVSEFSEANGGLIRASDFASFKAGVEEPARVEYRGYEVYKTGFWAQGPMMLQTLNILEGFDLRAMRHNSPDYIHALTEAMKLAFADRDRYYGDPDFVRVPGRELLSKDYAASRRALIVPARASMDQRPGDPVNKKALSDAPAGAPRTGESSVPEAERANDTTCVNVIDKDGNLFSATPSGAWLPAVVAGDTGVLMGQRLQSFLLEAGHPNVLAPGKRPRVTLTPTLVLKDGKPFLVLSTPGGDNQDQTLLQVLLNILEFGMNVQEAVEAPRFQTLHFVSSFDDHRFNPGVLNIEDRIGKDVAAELTSRGHKVEAQSAWGNPSAPTVILFRSDSGVIEAGADPRRGRYALAW
ncbi:MAG TPA: gamma-glutamyltransferase family protein [Blastocatellia bacterium]|nr:gamma-glutamyltransferase family protein [Blastocatellia bacterium]